MTSWFHILVEAVHDEWQSNPIIAALATVDPQGHPHVRHVICRYFQYESHSIWITSDSRSAKSWHIAENPNVELALWLPRRREQFRIEGNAQLTQSGIQSMWEMLSPATRATYFWPTPGDPRVAADFPASVPPDVKPAPNFEVIMVEPVQVELLELSPHPHRRRRWRRESDWIVENLNP